jgi:hypothetical protein
MGTLEHWLVDFIRTLIRTFESMIIWTHPYSLQDQKI